jgi:branched-chain amino acid aminotransferase
MLVSAARFSSRSLRLGRAAPPAAPAAAAAKRNLATISPPDPTVDFESFGFGLNVKTEWMWKQTWNAERGWDEGAVVPHGPLELEPSSTVINYGQSIFEGMKAFRQPDGGVSLFRPEMNAARMSAGAARFLLPEVPRDAFVRACDAVVAANSHWVPPHKGGTLYMRPLLFGSGAALGVAPSPEATFCIFVSPVGNYFKGAPGERAPPISLQVSERYRRAMLGGSGGTKAAGNYAPTFMASKGAKAEGFNEVLFVDAATGEHIEEAGASNFFAVVPAAGGGFELASPPIAQHTILPGVTRASVLQLAREELVGTHGLVGVAERPIKLAELAGWREGFCTGTGASVTAVGSVTVPAGVAGGAAEYQAAGWGEVSTAVAERLFGIQWGEADDPRGWRHAVR